MRKPRARSAPVPPPRSATSPELHAFRTSQVSSKQHVRHNSPFRVVPQCPYSVRKTEAPRDRIPGAPIRKYMKTGTCCQTIYCVYFVHGACSIWIHRKGVALPREPLIPDCAFGRTSPPTMPTLHIGKAAFPKRGGPFPPRSSGKARRSLTPPLGLPSPGACPEANPRRASFGGARGHQDFAPIGGNQLRSNAGSHCTGITTLSCKIRADVRPPEGGKKKEAPPTRGAPLIPIATSWKPSRQESRFHTSLGLLAAPTSSNRFR